MELLRPEDAASWEEFQARVAVAQRQCYGRYAPKAKLVVLLLGLLCGAGALVSLVVAVIAGTHDHWTVTGIAFACSVVLDAEHEAFANRYLPLLISDRDTDEALKLNAELIEQLGTLRAAVAASGIGYLGALAGEHDNRPALILLALAAARHDFPDPVDPASLLAALLRHQYPQAAVEEFPLTQGTGVGIRRAERFALQQPAATTGEPQTVDAGISQAFVPFPDAGLLGTVSSFTVNAEDIDLATVFTATIAYRMTAIAEAD